MHVHNRKEVAVAKAATRVREPLYTVPAAAEYLGCSEMHIYRLIAKGVLRAVDISMPGSGRSKTRIRPDDLGAYLEQQTRTA
jgi:excisionase family DNA binding protein